MLNMHKIECAEKIKNSKALMSLKICRVSNNLYSKSKLMENSSNEMKAITGRGYQSDTSCMTWTRIHSSGNFSSRTSRVAA